jgi:hypothetical protein
MSVLWVIGDFIEDESSIIGVIGIDSSFNESNRHCHVLVFVGKVLK